MNRDITRHLMLSSEVVDKEKTYWMRTLSGELTGSNFPYDHYDHLHYPTLPGTAADRGSYIKYIKDAYPFCLPDDLYHKLTRLSNNSGYNLFMVLLAAVNGLLNKYTGDTDIIITIPIYKQLMQGEFLNTVLVIRTRISSTMTFKELLLQVKASVIEANENVNYPIEELQGHLEISRDADGFSLFESAVLLEDIHEPGYLRDITPNILFSFRQSGERLEGTLEYNSRLYGKETVGKIIDRYIIFLRQVLEKPGDCLAGISLLSKQERRQIIEQFNATDLPYPREKTVNRLVEEQAAKIPHAIALVYEDQRITYLELNKKAGQLTFYLSGCGVQGSGIIGIMVEPSIQRMIGMLAIIKTRSAYLPIDAENPVERVNYMLTDCRAGLLLTRTNLWEKAGKAVLGTGKDIIDLDDTAIYETCDYLSPDSGLSTDLLYVIYTSGTSGKPKGVLINQENIVNYVTWFSWEAGLTLLDKTALASSFAFDLGYTSIYSSLLCGCQLHQLAKEDYFQSGRFLDYILDNKISYLKVTPSFFSLIVNSPDFSRTYLKTLRLVVLGGEAIDLADVEKFHAECSAIRVMNHYGPTEATIGCIAQYIDFSRYKEYKTTPTIGKPINNVRIYIIDPHHNPLPPGIPGELAISGIPLSSGYLNHPELTNKKFLRRVQGGGFYKKSPPGRRRQYKTGDLARWNLDGKIQFLGRIDHQVKIRGFRIEPAEIEMQLAAHPGIREVVVLVQEDRNQDQYLSAYFVADSQLQVSVLREFLSGHLPDYMIPQYFVPLEKIPLTANGKVDRRAFPSPRFTTGEKHIAPRTEKEERLRQIWTDVLHIDRQLIGMDSNFFDLGGHSLSAAILITEMHKVFEVKVPIVKVFERPTIEALAGYIEETSKQVFSTVKPVETKEYYPLSSAQTRLYFLQQMQLESTAYNIFQCVQLEGELEGERLAEIFKKLVIRHESLRTSFEMMAGKPVQKIYAPANLESKMEFCDASGETGAETSIRNFIRPFDLSQAPLFRVGLAEIGPLRYVLMVDLHHIISDGTSHSILISQFIYFLRGIELPLLRLHYKDFSQWQQSQAVKKVLQGQEAFWKQEFSGEIPVLNLPCDYPRPELQDFSGDLIDFDISENETKRINEILRAEGATMFMGQSAIFSVLLAKLSSQEDIVMGTPIAARRHADLQKIIGMFVNTLAIRHYLHEDISFIAFLRQVKKKTLIALENQDYLFEDLVEQVTLQRDLGRNPLFDVMLVYRNIYDTSLELSGEGIKGIRFKRYENLHQTSKFDLTLFAGQIDKKLYFSFEYCTRLFKEETIRRFINYFKKIVTSIVENPGSRISGIEIITSEEKQQILFDFNDKTYKTGFSADTVIHELFEHQVNRAPDHIAIAGAGPGTDAGIGAGQRSSKEETIQVTYNELNKRSNQLAHLLRKKDVKPDQLAGVMIERSIEMITAILGIIKAGGAYLPIDPQYPETRKIHMLKDSSVKLLLTNQKKERFSTYVPVGIEIIDINHETLYRGKTNNPELINKGADLIYVIYTSGSTGTPKGVTIQHRNVVNLMAFNLECTSMDFSKVLQYHSISFDASFNEIFCAFLAGGTLYVPGIETRSDVRELLKLVEISQISTLFLPMSLLRIIFNEEDLMKHIPTSVHHIQTAGEQVVISQKFKDFLGKKKVFLHNHYGPSETHVVTALEINPTKDIPGLPSIGRPVLNTLIYILDKGFNPVPIGVCGELFIGGIQVGRGYLDRPELTAEKFCLRQPGGRFLKKLPPWTPCKNFLLCGDRVVAAYDLSVYRSGDLARWVKEGCVEFLGRIDHQVKIRGFRVEPGEIESRLLDHPEIKEALVLAKKDEKGDGFDQYLYAYIACRNPGQCPEPIELREFLAQTLPDYMLPGYFIKVEEIPITPNGKIDRNALPEPKIQGKKVHKAPRNEIERKLVRLWTDVLSGDSNSASNSLSKGTPIGIDDNFFELGGHSLKAMVLAARIHKELQVKIPLAMIFKLSTIQGLARYITESGKEKYVALESIEKREFYKLSSAQKRLFILQQLGKNSTVYNLTAFISYEGKPHRQKLHDTFKKLTTRHESLRTSFPMINNEPVQRIHPETEIEIQIKDDDSTAVRPFDLSCAPLMRICLIKKNENHHLLVVDMHHVISDGVSQTILVNEFMSLYRETEPALFRLQYKDYAYWQEKEKEKPYRKHQEKYWLNRFGGEIPVLDLPTDYPRPPYKRFNGSYIKFDITASQTHELNALARKGNTTLYMIMLAIFNILLSKLSQQEDIVVGTPASGRPHADLQNIIGMFVNTLALRNWPQGEKTFHRFLLDIKENTLTAFENQDYQFEELVEKAVVNRDTSRNPLFDVMLVFQNLQEYQGPSEGFKTVGETTLDETSRSGYRKSRFDLTLTAAEIGDQLVFLLEYDTTLFKKETLERFIGYFKSLILQILEHPNEKIAHLEIISSQEKQIILHEFNNTSASFEDTGDELIHRLFARQVEKTADKIAVAEAAGLRMLSYRALNEQAHRLACLLTERGIRPGSIVALMGRRHLGIIIGILGILKAGGAYLPIDVADPPERLKYFFRDSQAEILLTGYSLSDKIENIAHIFPAKKIISLDEETISSQKTHQFESIQVCRVMSTDPAYLIYTSGTTGKSKGVMISHASAVNYISWAARQYVKNETINFALYTSLSFDMTVTSIFTPLLTGNILVLYEDEYSQLLVERIIHEQKVDILKLTPSHLKLIGSKEKGNINRQTRIKRFIVGGEELETQLAKEIYNRFSGNIEIYNEYGPTEATVGCMLHCFNPRTSPGKTVSLGKPAANTEIYILDIHKNPVPPGVVGEIHIEGKGVAIGYLNHPDLTARKFTKSTMVQGGRSNANKKFLRRVKRVQGGGFYKKSPPGCRRRYETGDLARWFVGGSIEFLGRKDHQVKLRGYRIELGEIEHRILEHKKIAEVLVVAGGNRNRNKYICSYIVLKKQVNLTEAEIREYLVDRLPGYMVPAFFVIIDRIPLSAGGKLDIRSLPEPGKRNVQTEVAYAVPETDLEKVIAGIWGEVLGLEHVGIHDHFFEIGGNSLDIIKIKEKLDQSLEREIELVKLFEYSTISALARYVQQDETGVNLQKSNRSGELEKGKQRRAQRQEMRKRRGIKHDRE